MQDMSYISLMDENNDKHIFFSCIVIGLTTVFQFWNEINSFGSNSDKLVKQLYSVRLTKKWKCIYISVKVPPRPTVFRENIACEIIVISAKVLCNRCWLNWSSYKLSPITDTLSANVGIDGTSIHADFTLKIIW